ncbi:aspartic peptidase domain-containing protein [Zychaea mexicana]|uniref:aspartic peptidase domain-containing protein n=1 Tax=Zychaea mexicana TaxID=64656 RepID=UPI0022FF02A2|nr:aspartic peptidase domain-containing protein [Zychaea mexicana]KAI9499175.1 aspartic peptidase domain-containing protein [Zychaea mexicana]
MNSSSAMTAHFDVYGYPECDYHVKLQVGETMMNLVLDTGSSNTAVISDRCDSSNCTFVQEPHLPVHPEALVNRVSARYGNAKTRSSWHGYATGQSIHFGNDKSATARVDAITSSNHFFVPRCPQNQGLWGLAYSKLQTRPHHGRYLNHELSSETLFDATRKQLHVPDAFSFQLCPSSVVDPLAAHGLSLISDDTSRALDEHRKSKEPSCNGSRVGHFWLGGYSSQSIQSPITWVSLIDSHYYEVVIDAFLVNGHPVDMHDDLNKPRTIVDTGTNDIILSTENLHRLLMALWKSNVIQFDRRYISPEYERAFWLEHAQLTLPSRAVKLDNRSNVSVSLSGQAIPIPLENLVKIHPVLEETSMSWINISWTGLSHGGGTRMAGTILGNTLMRGKTTIWDRGGRRLGFAEADPMACCQPSAANAVDKLLSIDDTLIATSSIHPNIHNMLESSSPFSSVDPGARFVHVLMLGLMIAACLGGLIHMGWMVWQHYYTKHKEEEKKQLEKFISEKRPPVIKIELPMPAHVCSDGDDDFEFIY